MTSDEIKVKVAEHTGGVYSSAYPASNMVNPSANKAFSSKNGNNTNIAFIFSVEGTSPTVASTFEYSGPGSGYTAPARNMLLLACGTRRPTVAEVKVFQNAGSLNAAEKKAKVLKSRLTPLLYFQGHTAKTATPYTVPRHPPSTHFALLAIDASGSGTNMDVGRVLFRGVPVRETQRVSLPTAGFAEPLRYADHHNLFGQSAAEQDEQADGQTALSLLFGVARPVEDASKSAAKATYHAPASAVTQGAASAGAAAAIAAALPVSSQAPPQTQGAFSQQQGGMAFQF